ncbi:Isoleucine-tRNA ligase, cytoplasmic [Zancudomyces culisetae]|uniref:Isoleucine--tRNA ligase, cytoplasmic n=1 Tax=Zancudomyces culisetae TaxID=1213189 RepID=A0A1R1PJH4_ZANCU|nr:Isoleucine-tRNA ligase, cytoplasmic [Zancudomyces culisetae]OMH84148.1 Isoleucine-tRNA ligase, cytoplasmic [Zancudomyces culisetae]|eukprot:OMH81083.1 Isoleucine-tRNA ligase, cytoplasmic [Zancudomyces culisetae]
MATEQETEQFTFAKEEEKIIKYWREIDAFQTSLKLAEGRKHYTFYDGPPFATGLPHYGHLLAGTVKDVVTRFAANTGHYVQRRFGWDCHGLPVEYEIDKMLEIKYKQQVYDMGIDKYNAACRGIVMRYAGEWRTTVERLGRWIDFDNDYKTLNTSFMESVWWVFKQLYEKEQVYRGVRVMPYSTGCTTPLSNFEAGQNYKDVSDPAVVVGFKVAGEEKTYFAAWTTTPWTLPSNLALCVHKDMDYVKIEDAESGNVYILAEKRLCELYKNPAKAKMTVLEKMKGSALVGMRYEPLFDYFAEEYKERAFKVLQDDYVTDDSGTGVVHQAPGFGEDDFRVCQANGVIGDEADDLPCPVDEDGRFTKQVSDFCGIYVKDADKEIMRTLKGRGQLIRQGTLVHSYPFCWRSDTPLLYRAVPSWFVRVRNIQEKLLAANQATRWVPGHVREKRFANWLENARDWNISRNRFWGTPIPLWANSDYSEIVCVGSVAELEELTGVSGIVDLHRDTIDGLEIPSKKNPGTMLRRVEEVFDCWFESGSMPYSQNHYPFENKEHFEANFPADFISEGIDQTRGWFYTLLVLSVHLRNTAPWKNLICTGLVLASDGKKMSKRLKNYPDPNIVIDRYGADALRLYLINSPVVRGEVLKFKEEGVREVVSKVFLPWFNASKFFLSRVEDLGVDFQTVSHHVSKENIMDRWIMAATQSLIRHVRTEMAAYRLYTVVPVLVKMVDQLTNWYLRFNRKRLKGDDGPRNACDAANTLFSVLLAMCRIMSSFTPYITEMIYQSLRPFISAHTLQSWNISDSRSVHFLQFPEVQDEYFDPEIERAVQRMQSVIELARVVREKNNLSLKTPLDELVVVHSDPQYLDDIRQLSSYISAELNVRNLVLSQDETAYGISYKAEPDYKKLGTKLRKNLPKVKAALPNIPAAEIKAALSTGFISVVDDITLTSDEINIVRFFDDLCLSDSHKHKSYHANSDKDVVILLSTALSPDLIDEGLARELVNRIQRLRKKAGLQPNDPVTYYLQFNSDPNDSLLSVLSKKEAFLFSLLKQEIFLVPVPQDSSVLIQDIHDVNGSSFTLTFCT